MTLEAFFEKFDLFADAPDAVEKMRELVRHLAVTGTLVEQDDNDEPALALLDRIAAHKTALAKEGKLRGPTTVTPMSPDEGPRVLPSSWTWVRFGEVMVNRDGERIPVSKEERSTKAKTYDYYGASGVIDKIDGYLFDKPLLLIGEDGANLINRSTPIAFMARGQYWVNNHAHVLDGISQDFLRYIELHINAINLESYVTGSAQPKMNQAKMNSIPIALPPLAEQKRIVAKVDELMALCDRLEAQQQERETRHAALARASLARFADAPTPANLDFIFHKSYAIPPADLRKSILTLAFQGDLTNCEENDLAKAGAAKVLSDAATARRNYWSNRHGTKRKYPEPEGFESEDLPRIRSHWMWASIDCLCAQVTDGEHIQPPYQAEGVPMLSAKHVRDGHVTLEGAGLISEEAFQKSIERCKPENGDILIVSVGATTGRSAIVANCPRFAIVRSVLLLKPVIMKEYLLWWLKNPWSFTWMTQASGASAQPHLYIRDLKHMPVPIPPLAEQRRIVAKVEQLMALVDALETQLAASRTTAANLLSALVAELTAD